MELYKQVKAGQMSMGTALEKLANRLELLKKSKKWRDLKESKLVQKEIDAILDIGQDDTKPDAALDEIWERSRRGG
jgi:hypothetical protein